MSNIHSESLIDSKLWFSMFKGTLMQIWKSANIFEDFTLKLFEICAC